MAAAAAPSVVTGIRVSGASHRFHLHKATARAQERRPPAAPFLLRVVVSASTQLLRILTNQSGCSFLERCSCLVQMRAGCHGCVDVGLSAGLLLDREIYQNALRGSLLFCGSYNQFHGTKLTSHGFRAFSGTDLYESNLKLLIPFLEEPSLSLFSLNQDLVPEGQTIRAVWRLRTYLKLPWRPLICIDGSTVYTLDENLMIVKHIESWAVSPFDAISQIFKSGDNI